MSRSGRMLIVLLLIACSWSSDRPFTAATRRTVATGRHIDQDYVLALTTANEFLEAWRHRTVPQAMALLSPEARQRYRDRGRLEQYLSGISNPHHQAYEVWDGRTVAPGRIAFSVRLYEFHTAEPWHGERPRPSSIVLVKTGPWEWKVARLPYWPWKQQGGQ